ncbi:MAG: cell wall-binding repeat-containing protein [Desulfitobacterium sp.]
MSFKQLSKTLITGVITVSLVISLVPPTFAEQASDAPVIDRIAGDNRFQTASAIAEKSYPRPVQNVILASGLNFLDALTS